MKWLYFYFYFFPIVLHAQLIFWLFCSSRISSVMSTIILMSQSDHFSVCQCVCFNPCWTHCLLLTELTSRPYKRNWVSLTWMNNRGNDWKPSSPRKPRSGNWRMRILNPYVSWVPEMEEWSTRSATNHRIWSWLERWTFTSCHVDFICIAQ